MKSNIKFNSLNSEQKDDTEVEISSSGFVMCKINRCLIISNLMSSELESLMIFYLVFQTLASKRIHFVFLPLVVPLAFQFVHSKC